MAQEMYKHDALLHLVWCVATASKKEYEESTVTKNEDGYLDIVRKKEGIDIDWDDFNAKRKELGYDKETIIDEACKALRGCGEEWKIKCLGYMTRMAGTSLEDREDMYMSDDEWALILRAQQELKLSDEDRKNSTEGLPNAKRHVRSSKYGMLWLVWLAVKTHDLEPNSKEKDFLKNICEKEDLKQYMVDDIFSYNVKKYREEIIDESFYWVNKRDVEFKKKTLQYMYKIAGLYKDDKDKDGNVSAKEWSLVYEAQKFFGLDVDDW